jgi:hypothetical protein
VSDHEGLALGVALIAVGIWLAARRRPARLVDQTVFIVRNLKNLLAIAFALFLLAWWAGAFSNDQVERWWERFWDEAARIPFLVFLAFIVGAPAVWHWINRAYTLRGPPQMPPPRSKPYGWRKPGNRV